MGRVLSPFWILHRGGSAVPLCCWVELLFCLGGVLRVVIGNGFVGLRRVVISVLAMVPVL